MEHLYFTPICIVKVYFNESFTGLCEHQNQKSIDRITERIIHFRIRIKILSSVRPSIFNNETPTLQPFVLTSFFLSAVCPSALSHWKHVRETREHKWQPSKNIVTSTQYLMLLLSSVSKPVSGSIVHRWQ